MSVEIVGKKVGPIGYGLMGLTVRPKPLADDVAIAAIKAAVDAGCTYLNAGEFYGPPDNNSLTLLNKYFAKYPEDAAKVVLNVKGGLDTKTMNPDGSREKMVKNVEDSLGWLGPHGRIDQFEPCRKDPNVDYEGVTLAAVDELVKAGKVGAIAISEVNAATIRSAAKKYKITSVELELSMFTLEPMSNGTLAACAELGIPVLAYTPLGKGLLSGDIKSPEDIPEGDFRKHLPRFQPENFKKNIDLVDRVSAIAKRKGCTPAQVAINWILSLSKREGMPTIIPIPGSANPARIRENATIVDLADEDLAEIDGILKTFVPAGTRYPEHLMKHVQL